MDRKPPISIRRILRKEVGFGCPVSGCGSPYLTWHHFDPPWNVREHHNPNGMIALCRQHHDQADAGAFTVDQLKDLKRNGQLENIAGKFNWMRRTILFAGGGNYFINPYIILRYGGKNIIWFTRDEDGYFLLNINFINRKGELRFQIEENFWNIIELPKDIKCPPSGKKINVQYDNGDRLFVEFLEIGDKQIFENEFKTTIPSIIKYSYPITIARIFFKDNDAMVELSDKTILPGFEFSNIWSQGGTGVAYNL